MIKIKNIAYARFGAPDLDAMARFLTDFGLVVAARENGVLYARGSDPSPYVHVTELGEAGFRGLAFESESSDDLLAVAEREGARVEKIEGPGGGRRVRLRDPDGYEIDLVYGRELLPALHVPTARINRGSDRQRRGVRRHVEAGPPRVKRIGHAGLLVGSFRESEAWYKSRFGLLSSDEIHLGDEANVIAAFMRCDRGAEPADHHTLVCVAPPDGATGLDHVSFEVEDFDAVMTGHEHLERAGYEHKMGVGRHILGSQVYDYWRDPWGNVLEHFTDGDLLDASHPTGLHDPATALGSHWGKIAI